MPADHRSGSGPETERPLLLVDVDGVISLFGPAVDPAACVPALVEGIPHLLSRRAAGLLARLAPRFECVWCTGWEDRAESHLPHLLDLPGGWRHLVFSDRPEDAGHWKLRAIDAFAGPGRPVAWIDDAHDERCRAWAAARPGPTLLVSTDPDVGLVEAHAERLEQWARQAPANRVNTLAAVEAGTRIPGEPRPAAPEPAGRRPAWLALLVTARPRQWVKNLLVLAVPAAAGVLGEPAVIRDTALALAAFCLASAGTYLLNDVADREADRVHPSKRRRPVAAGEVSSGAAVAAGAGALVLGCLVAWLAEPGLALVVGAYVLLTTAYSRWLKHVPVFDIAVVASGFFLRAVAGGVASDLFISKWFLILSGGGSLFLVTAKRYAELRGAGDEVHRRRPVLTEYSEDYLRAMLATTAGVVVVAYCIWCFEDRAGGAQSALTSASAVPFVLGIMRYGLLVDQGHGEEPEALLLGDRTLLALAACCLGLLALGTVW